MIGKENKITDLYDRIKKLSKQKGVSQIDLCRQCEINLQSHRGRISKVVSPDIFELLKIAQFLGTTVEYLVTGEETNIYKEKYDKLRQKADAAIEYLKD